MNKWKWSGLYVLCVLLFGCAYFGYWWINPDSFIINPELNIQPFHEINQFLWEDDSIYQVDSVLPLRELKKSYDNIYKEINVIDAELIIIEERKGNIENEYDMLSKKRSLEIKENFAEYDESTLKSYKYKEIKLKDEIKNLESKVPKVIKSQSDVEKIKALGAKKVELAEARLQTARKASVNADFLLSHMASFMSKETQDDYIRLSKETASMSEKRFELEQRRGNIRSQALNLIGNNLKNTRNRINISDFMFFSVGISTTTTFGDLIANNRIARLAVSFQLLLCIFIVGGFVNSVIKS